MAEREQEVQVLVPETGIEPVRPLSGKRRILSPLCLPISPSRLSRPLNVRQKQNSPGNVESAGLLLVWRRVPESNRPKRICNPLHNRFATAPTDLAWKIGKPLLPFLRAFGAGDESRTRDLNLGKVALYQLSYSRENFDEFYREFMA